MPKCTEIEGTKKTKKKKENRINKRVLHKMAWAETIGWQINGITIQYHHNSMDTHTRTKQKNTIYSISRSMDVFMGTYWRFEKPEPKKIDIWRLYSITDNNIFIWHRSDFYLTAYAVYEPFYIGKWNLICFANVAKKKIEFVAQQNVSSFVCHLRNWNWFSDINLRAHLVYTKG